MPSADCAAKVPHTVLSSRKSPSTISMPGAELARPNSMNIKEKWPVAPNSWSWAVAAPPSSNDQEHGEECDRHPDRVAEGVADERAWRDGRRNEFRAALEVGSKSGGATVSREINTHDRKPLAEVIGERSPTPCGLRESMEKDDRCGIIRCAGSNEREIPRSHSFSVEVRAARPVGCTHDRRGQRCTQRNVLRHPRR